MANLAATVAAIEKYCGFPAARIRTVAERLLEAKLLEPGAPGVAVVIGPADLALLIFGLASGAPLRAVADRTADLCSCVPDGIDVNVMPEAIRSTQRTAFDVLHDIVWNAAHGDGQLRFDVEVVETFPEVSFRTPDGVARFQPAGSLSGHWQSGKQRCATTIPHSALLLAARNLFSEKN
ncbi:hypothetical protein [Mesorhizobium sp. CA7]|uniref:hypothetical protein n=1 Tax=Mesorhizobium sp. CA7 TaxID=588501 RepID=UPI001CCD9C5C|nr:hypothetical protein [Mesorhizobium sp. CA7]MBZ9815046.1 hypothetical protein [Mesorhizobium sp. CA7]